MYSTVGWKRFLIAVLIVSAPLFILEQSSPKLARQYVTAILLGMAFYNWQGLERFAGYLISLVRSA